jgi:LysM repeat protein
MAAYTIQPGDSLSRIASNNGVTLQQLLGANQGLRSTDLIFPGQKLQLPANATPGQARPAGSSSGPNNRPSEREVAALPTITLLHATYHVHSGDSWASIAHKEGVSVEDLKRANPQVTRGERLTPRMVLNLPIHADSAVPPLLAVPDKAPYFSQADARWGNDQMGGGRTLQSGGCAVTSVSSALAQYNILIDGELANPKTFNAWLNRNGGYAGEHGNSIVWGVVEKLSPDVHLKGLYGKRPLLLMQHQLDEGYSIIANVHEGEHWVLLTGHRGKVFPCMDPGFSSESYRYAEIVGSAVYEITSFSGDLT